MKKDGCDIRWQDTDFSAQYAEDSGLAVGQASVIYLLDSRIGNSS